MQKEDIVALCVVGIIVAFVFLLPEPTTERWIDRCTQQAAYTLPPAPHTVVTMRVLPGGTMVAPIWLVSPQARNSAVVLHRGGTATTDEYLPPVSLPPLPAHQGYQLVNVHVGDILRFNADDCTLDGRLVRTYTLYTRVVDVTPVSITLMTLDVQYGRLLEDSTLRSRE